MVFLSFFSSILFALLNAFSIWMISSLISTIMKPNNIQLIQKENISINDRLEQFAINLIGTGSQLEQLKMLCIILVLTFIVKNIFFIINNICLTYVGNKMIMDIRNQLFSHIQKLPIAFFQKNKSGNLTSIMMNDVNNLKASFSGSIQSLINDPISMVIILSMLFITNIKMTIYVLITVPISAYIITKLGQSIRRKSMRTSIQIADLMNIFQETVTGIRVIKAFVMEKAEIINFKKANNKFFRLTFIQENMRNLTVPINDIIGISLGVMLLWIGGSEVLVYNNLDSDGFMRYIVYLFAMLQPAKKLGSVYTQLQSGMASAERVMYIIDEESNITNPISPIFINDIKNSIKFENVSFHYENSKQPSLLNIDLTIPKNKTLAIVGSSGSGKSTMIDLIPRFHDVTNGKILIDNINIKDIAIDKLRSLFGIVSQETILFNDTIANNISYGNKNVTAEKLKAAIKAANLDKYVYGLPERLNTIVGEKGTKLSGGQKQRLSIARAILKNPKILILDEATSSLDTASERKVQKAIDNLVKNKTVIVIAHRLSTIINADKIIVLNQGKLIESGTHKSLISEDGHYKNLYEIQFGAVPSK